jgi:peptidoglycan/LPS O-acetylase OafA/YrhL
MRRWLSRLIPNYAVATSATKARASHGKISALDGLRGLACLFVLHEHWTNALDSPWERPKALQETTSGLMWQPYLVLLWAG